MIYNSFDKPGLVKVLTFLQAHNTEYLSGQDLSDVLHISRVAVWKHIKKIQELGYTVESKQKSGYRLTSNSQVPLPWEVTSELKTKIIGQRAFYFDSTDSTQNQALKMAKDAKNNGAIIIAGRQTEGRGRSGRKWVSPKGGIWMSVILHPKFDVSVTTLFPIASSLALSYAIEKVFRKTPELKWPNDLTIKDKKVAGMLVDASLQSNKIENLVLGVGINFDADAAKQIEKNLMDTPNFYGVAALGDLDKKIKPVQLVREFLQELEKIYNLLHEQRTGMIISEWTKRSSTIGKEVEINTPNNGRVRGRAQRIDDDGSLVISNKKGSLRVIAGDLIHLAAE